MAFSMNWIEVNPLSPDTVLGEIPYLDLGALLPGTNTTNFATTTTATFTIAAGLVTVSVASTTHFEPGQIVLINDGSHTVHYLILSIGSGVLHLTSNPLSGDSALSGTMAMSANVTTPVLNVHAFKLQIQGCSIAGAPFPNPASTTTRAISLSLVSPTANVYSYATMPPTLTLQESLSGLESIGLGVFACVLPETNWCTGDFATNWTNLLTTSLNITAAIVPPILSMDSTFNVVTPPIGFALQVPSGITGTYDIRNLRLRINFATYDESNPIYT
jgi:hypothetical protein